MMKQKHHLVKQMRTTVWLNISEATEHQRARYSQVAGGKEVEVEYVQTFIAVSQYVEVAHYSCEVYKSNNPQNYSQGRYLLV